MRIEFGLLYVLVLQVIAFCTGLIIGNNKKKKLEEKIVKLEDEKEWEHTIILKLERELAGAEKKIASVNNSSAKTLKMPG